MSKLSRRALSRFVANELIAGKTAAEVAKEIAAVMVEQGMEGGIDFLLDDVAWELENRGEISVGRVISARPLSTELKKALTGQIKKSTRVRSVLLEEEIDKAVLGGARVETPSKVWDGTIAKRLADLREVC